MQQLVQLVVLPGGNIYRDCHYLVLYLIPTPARSAQISVSPTATTTLLFTYHGHRNNISGVAWSPDGRYIASTAYDNTVQVWSPYVDNDLANPQLRGVFIWFWSKRYLVT